ncbi:MAG: hypothetical protein AWU57_466 [Marinobacter sp. T13-3]|nr:MAG: hypothetical protein AWU57_466 [Marinobacter sp. T13-3]
MMLEPLLCLSCNGHGRVNADGKACHPDNAVTTCPTCRGAGKTGFLGGKERLQNVMVAAAERLAGDPEQAPLVSTLDIMAKELSKYVLAPAPSSKVAYAGGEVCGVLVRDPSGKRSGVTAITDAGRATRLDDRIMGPVDPAPVRPPATITDEMKAKCISEFEFTVEVPCGQCLVEGEDDECEVCHGEGSHERAVTVPWDTCKAIYKRMARYAPQPEGAVGWSWDGGRFGRQFTTDPEIAHRLRQDGVLLEAVYTRFDTKTPDYWVVHQKDGSVIAITDPDDAELRRSFGERVEPVSVHQTPAFGEAPATTGQMPDNVRLVLEAIAHYPRTRDQELSAPQMRQMARDALATNPPTDDSAGDNATVAWAWINRGRPVTVDKAFARELIADGETVRPLTYADTTPE